MCRRCHKTKTKQKSLPVETELNFEKHYALNATVRLQSFNETNSKYGCVACCCSVVATACLVSHYNILSFSSLVYCPCWACVFDEYVGTAVYTKHEFTHTHTHARSLFQSLTLELPSLSLSFSFCLCLPFAIRSLGQSAFGRCVRISVSPLGV